MYNRYIPNGASYTRIPVEEPGGPQSSTSRAKSKSRGPEGRAGQEPPNRGRGRRPERGGQGPFSLASFLTGEGGSGGLGGLLKALKLEDLDSGDLLLLLIVLLLLWEGDALELVIALGLVLILGLGDEPEEEADGR